MASDTVGEVRHVVEIQVNDGDVSVCGMLMVTVIHV